MPQKCGFISIIGATNAGKSTLINTLVGAKVSIVSRKVQTTRQQIRGIALVGDAQVVFIDTPGFFNPRRRLDKAMVNSAWGSTRDADMIGLLVDARAFSAKVRSGFAQEMREDNIMFDEEKLLPVLEVLAKVGKPKFLILNKIDMVERQKLLEMSNLLNAHVKFEETFMISALKGDGCAAIMKWLEARVPEGPWHYPDDQLGDMADRELAAEITREVIYDRLHEELPYDSTVETTVWQRKSDNSVRLEQTITVARSSQKKIVVGKNGETIKAISTAARKQMTEVFEYPVHVFLFVKVRENWSDDPELFRRMGLDFSA